MRDRSSCHADIAHEMVTEPTDAGYCARYCIAKSGSQMVLAGLCGARGVGLGGKVDDAVNGRPEFLTARRAERSAGSEVQSTEVQQSTANPRRWLSEQYNC